MKKLFKNFIFNIVPKLLVVLFIVTALLPFIWTFLTSIKPPGQIFSIPPEILPSKIYFDNYIRVFTTRPFSFYIRNSIVVAFTTSILCIIIGSFAAFALSRFKIRYKKVILYSILAVSMFPQVSIVSPLFLFFKKINFINSYQGLVLPYMTFSLPLTIWFLNVYFRKIPQDLEDAALVDGCTKFQTFTKIIFPLARPGLITTFILSFIFCWNEFLFALVFTMDKSTRTAPVGIALFTSRYQIPWGEICAATVIVTIPLLVLVMFTTRRIISGLTGGALR